VQVQKVWQGTSKSILAFALLMEVAASSFGSFALLDLLTFLVKQEVLDNTHNKVETKNCHFFLF
jgi:hypothetical protein